MANSPSMNHTPSPPPAENGQPTCQTEERSRHRSESRPIGGLRPKLLYERYGIRENPFGVTPNPLYLYESKTHAEARSSLIIGVECGVGFQALIAPPGMGKTTILFNIGERFDKVARIAFLSQLHGDSRDFLHYLVAELGEEAHDSNSVGMQDTINRLLVREYRAGRQTIIVIDEAQNLTTSVLETVRQLSNFETPSEKLVQIILAGQPQLAQRLASPEMTQLQQRIPMLTTLLPFGLNDTRSYIEHRLKVAGYQGPQLFTSGAVRLIWKLSGGIPRKINTLCFNALLLAKAAGQQIDSRILREVVADLDLDHLRFDIDTQAGGRRGVQTVNGSGLGNTAAHASRTRMGASCKTDGLSAKVEAEAVCERRETIHAADLAESRTITAETVSASYGTVPETGKDLADTVRGASLADQLDLSSHSKTDVMTFARAEPAAPHSSTDAAPSNPEAPVAEAESMPDAKPNLSPEVESELHSRAHCGLTKSIIKPVLKWEIDGEPESDIGSDLESGSKPAEDETALTAAGEPRLMLVDPKSKTAQLSPGTSSGIAIRWLKQHRQVHASTIFLGISILILLFVLSNLGTPSPPTNSRKANLTFLDKLQLSLGLAEPPPVPVYRGNPKTRVWVDLRAALYYCPGADLYGKTRKGKFAAQQDAQQDRFEPANHKACD
jgi:type II secretory pathway predicted ATPase ExeA